MPVMVVVGEVLLVITAVPLCTVHCPLPTVAVLAAIVKVLVLHWSMLIPASAIVGVALLVKITSSVVGVHTPLLMVHRKVTLKPAFNPVTVLVLLVGVVMLAPLAAPTIVHNPELMVGALPVSVKLPLLHCSWSAPALAMVGVW
jgi:hypothetical protein